MDKDEIG